MTIQDILDELIKAGLSQQYIADQCETTQATISRTIKGTTTPGYELGKSIEKLHKRTMRVLARRVA